MAPLSPLRVLVLVLLLSGLNLASPSVVDSTSPSDIGYEGMDLSRISLSLNLNTTDATVLGNLTIEYHNSDPETLSSIPFHIYLSGMSSEGRPGDTQILSVTEGNTSKTPLSYDVYSEEQLMWAYLGTTLAPGEEVTLEIAFRSILPTDGIDRSCVAGTDVDESKIYEFASAYPIPCVYDEYDGWNTDPYLSVGDPFYLDMAYYNVTLETPDELVVAATGELVDHSSYGGRSTYVFAPLHPVREFTFCASEYYIVESTIYKGVNVSSFYLPESVSLWATNGLQWGIDSLSLYNDTFGEYPYSTLNVVEDYGWYYGMEYPCQVYMSNIITDQYLEGTITAAVLESVIAHEVAHQWWYQLVGNDEIDQGFLDEGLVCWSVYYYSEAYGRGWPGVINNLNTVRTAQPTRINQSIYDDEDNYVYAAYVKAPVVLEKLRQTLGHEVFLCSLREFFNQFAFKIAFLWDLQAVFEQVVGQDLDWFFCPMFDNNALPLYDIDNVTYYTHSRALDVEIVDLNEPLHRYSYRQNLTLQVYTLNGTLKYTDVEVSGNCTSRLYLPENFTGNPTLVSILFTGYTLVNTYHLYTSTSAITLINDTVTTTTAGFMLPLLTLGGVVGVACVALVVVTRVRRR